MATYGSLFKVSLGSSFLFFKRRLLNFNAGKCKVMHVGVGARNGRANYFMEGTEIQKVSEEKNLGVVVDEKLNLDSVGLGILQPGVKLLLRPKVRLVT